MLAARSQPKHDRCDASRDGLKKMYISGKTLKATFPVHLQNQDSSPHFPSELRVRLHLCPHTLKVNPPSKSLLGPTVGRCKSATSASSSRLREAAGPGANASVVILLSAAPSGSHAPEPATSFAALRRFSKTRVQSALWTTRSGLGLQRRHATN